MPRRREPLILVGLLALNGPILVTREPCSSPVPFLMDRQLAILHAGFKKNPDTRTN